MVAVTYRGTGADPDAILAYSEMLCAALTRTGRMTGSLVTGRPGESWFVDGRRGTPDMPGAVEPADGVLLQYNPFSYGRWGFAPWLLRDLRRLRRAGKPLAVMVHEAFLAPTKARQRPVTTWQRAQFKGILGQVDAAFAATESLCDALREVGARCPVHHAPVGSNLPDRRSERESVRRRLDLAHDDLALVAFGTGHPSQLGSWVGRAVRAAGRPGHRLVVLNLGAGAHQLERVPPDVVVHTPGRLDSGDLASLLAAGDLFVAPFSDGVSTRRTTVMAALQHELPVVTTRAHSTDRLLSESRGAIRLVDAGDPRAFEAAVGDLAQDQAARRELRLGGRRFYEERFAWPVIAERFAGSLIAAWGDETSRKVQLLDAK